MKLIKVGFEEDKHPRGDDGKFSSGGGGGGGKKPAPRPDDRTKAMRDADEKKVRDRLAALAANDNEGDDDEDAWADELMAEHNARRRVQANKEKLHPEMPDKKQFEAEQAAQAKHEAEQRAAGGKKYERIKAAERKEEAEFAERFKREYPKYAAENKAKANKLVDIETPEADTNDLPYGVWEM